MTPVLALASLIVLASVAPEEPIYATTPCRQIEARDAVPSLIRSDDWVLALNGSQFARKAMGLGFLRIRLDGVPRRADDYRVRRVWQSRFPTFSEERLCDINIEGPA